MPSFGGSVITRYQRQKVVVTGICPFSSIGIGKDIFWDNLLQQKTGLIKERCDIGGEVWDEFYFHKVQNFSVSDHIVMKDVMAEIDSWRPHQENRDLLYFIVASKLALQDSGLDVTGESNTVGAVFAHENPGINEFLNLAFSNVYEDFVKQKISCHSTKLEFFKYVFSSLSKNVYGLQTFMFSYHIGKALGVHGSVLFMNNACASGLYAIDVASRLIASKQCDSVIVSAVDSVDIFKYLWFKELNIYAKDGILRPYSKFSTGFVFGEGGAALVLESQESALRRGAKIYAEYLGGSFGFEGWKVSVPAVGSNIYKNLMLSVLKKCKVQPRDVDLIIPHGVGTRLFDQYETKAIDSVFSASNFFPKCTALKPYFGHCLGGSALLESVAGLLMMEKGVVLPTLNVDKQSTEIEFNLVVDKPVANNTKYFLKTSAAFAGFDGAVLFRRN